MKLIELKSAALMHTSAILLNVKMTFLISY